MINPEFTEESPGKSQPEKSPWKIVCPFIADGTVTRRVQRSSHSLIPISLKLNTSSAQA
jgi:hypothetical protein